MSKHQFIVEDNEQQQQKQKGLQNLDQPEEQIREPQSDRHSRPLQFHYQLEQSQLLVHPKTVLLQGNLSKHPSHNARDTAEAQPKHEHVTIATSHQSGGPASDHAKRQEQVRSILAIQSSEWLAYLRLLIALWHLSL